jgi:hypothetical protein
MILIEPAGRLDREIEAVVADLAAGADGLGLGRLGLLAGLGEEPLRVLVAAGSRFPTSSEGFLAALEQLR